MVEVCESHRGHCHPSLPVNASTYEDNIFAARCPERPAARSSKSSLSVWLRPLLLVFIICVQIRPDTSCSVPFDQADAESDLEVPFSFSLHGARLPP